MPAINPLIAQGNSKLSGAIDLIAITPADGADLTYVCRLLYIGVGGDVSVITTSGTTVVHKNAPTGGYIGPFSVARVLATGTTATNLIGYV